MKKTGTKSVRNVERILSGIADACDVCVLNGYLIIAS
jgi:hypothetical protein